MDFHFFVEVPQNALAKYEEETCLTAANFWVLWNVNHTFQVHKTVANWRCGFVCIMELRVRTQVLPWL